MPNAEIIDHMAYKSYSLNEEEKMRVYLDNCCFNRPFDDQTSLIVQFETDAKLRIQELIKQKEKEIEVLNPIDFVRRYVHD